MYLNGIVESLCKVVIKTIMYIDPSSILDWFILSTSIQPHPEHIVPVAHHFVISPSCKGPISAVRSHLASIQEFRLPTFFLLFRCSCQNARVI